MLQSSAGYVSVIVTFWGTLTGAEATGAEGVRMLAGLDSNRRQDTVGRLCDGLVCGTVPAGGHRGLPLHPQQHPGCHHHLWSVGALRRPARVLPLEGLHCTQATSSCLGPPACDSIARFNRACAPEVKQSLCGRSKWPLAALTGTPGLQAGSMCSIVF